jgi:hypothetical protein
LFLVHRSQKDGWLAVKPCPATQGVLAAGDTRRGQHTQESAEPFGETHRPQPRSRREHAFFRPLERIGYLLAWTVPLLFCADLLGLAVLPLFGLAVPRRLILA